MSNPRLLAGRSSAVGAYYAITIVCRARRRAFDVPSAVAVARAEFQQCDARGATASHAWVIMPDHIHWVLELKQGTLGAAVQAFKSRTTRELNRTATTGSSLWQVGYFDHRLRGEDDLRAQCRYVIANPVRAGLVHSIDEHPGWWCRWVTRAHDLA